VQGRNTRKRAKPQDAALMKQAVYAVKQMTLVTVKYYWGPKLWALAGLLETMTPLLRSPLEHCQFPEKLAFIQNTLLSMHKRAEKKMHTINLCYA